MSERYSTEAIACGLMDVAGWLENEGWTPKHVRQIRAGAERLRELEAALPVPVTADEFAEMNALNAAASPGRWGIYEQGIRDQRDPIRELTDQVWATKPLGEYLYLLEAEGKCPATTGCGLLSEANAKFIATLVNGYRSGHLRPLAEGHAPAKSQETREDVA